MNCPTFVSIVKLFRALNFEVKFGVRGFNVDLPLLLCRGPVCVLGRRLFQGFIGWLVFKSNLKNIESGL